VGVGIEIEPKYLAVTLQRLADMGLEPKLEKPKPSTRKRNGQKKAQEQAR